MLRQDPFEILRLLFWKTQLDYPGAVLLPFLFLFRALITREWELMRFDFVFLFCGRVLRATYSFAVMMFWYCVSMSSPIWIVVQICSDSAFVEARKEFDKIARLILHFRLVTLLYALC